MSGTVEWALRGLIVFVALVNLAPVSGVLSADRLEALYGLTFADPNLLVLMRHRAVLFGIVGGLLAVSVFRPALRNAAFAAAAVSMASFVVLALAVGGYNEQIARVVWADVVALVALGVAVVLARIETSRGRFSAPRDS